MAGGGSFVTGPLSLHTTTNISVIEKFLPIHAEIEDSGSKVRVTIRL